MRGASGGGALLLLIELSLVGCGASPAGVAPRAYALSCGTPGQTGFANRSLTIIDRATWTLVRTVTIGGHGAASLSVDPEGRLWVSHHGPADAPESTVEVFSAAGDKLADLTTCAAGHRAIFVGGTGWVACEGNGFVGALARIEVGGLSPSAPLALSFPGSDAFTVSAAGVVGGVVAVAGKINGGAGVLLEDPAQRLAPTSVTVGPGIDIVDVLPAGGGEGLLLNAISGQVLPPGSAPDVVELSGSVGPPFSLTKLSIVPSPRAGVVVAGDLYVYSFAAGAAQATVARRSSTTGALTTWPSALPGTVDQMATDGAVVFLAHSETTSDAKDGIYELDPSSGALTRRLALPDVSDLAISGPASGP